MATKELILRIGRESDTGPTRQSNEDYTGHCVPEDEAQRRSKGAIFLVADGMGGHRAGEVASREAVLCTQEQYYADPSGDVGSSLLGAFEIANEKLYQLAQADAAKQGMGTTLVAAVIVGQVLYVANVGDSRAYLLRGRHLTQITTDHSWVEEQIRAGFLTRKQAEKHPQRNLITRALGIKPTVEVDLFTEKLRPHDLLLLCTDGLSNALDVRQIARILDSMPPEEAATELVAQAAIQAGNDNASAVLVRASPSTQRTLGLLPRAARRRRLVAGGVALLVIAIAAAAIAGFLALGQPLVGEPAGAPQLGPIQYPELAEDELARVAHDLGYESVEQIRRDPALDWAQGAGLWPAEPGVFVAGMARNWRCRGTACAFALAMRGKDYEVRCEPCLAPDVAASVSNTPSSEEGSPRTLNLAGRRVRLFGHQPEEGAVVIARLIDRAAPWWAWWQAPWANVYQAPGHDWSEPAWVYGIVDEITYSPVHRQDHPDLEPGAPILIRGRWWLGGPWENVDLVEERLYQWDGSRYVLTAGQVVPTPQPTATLQPTSTPGD